VYLNLKGKNIVESVYFNQILKIVIKGAYLAHEVVLIYILKEFAL